MAVQDKWDGLKVKWLFPILRSIWVPRKLQERPPLSLLHWSVTSSPAKRLQCLQFCRGFSFLLVYLQTSCCQWLQMHEQADMQLMQIFVPCFPSRKAALTTLNHYGLENYPQRLLSWKHDWRSLVLLGEWRLHAVRTGPQDHSYLSSGGLASRKAKHFFHWHTELQAQKQESQPGIKTNLTFPTTHLPQVFCSTNGHRHALLTLHIDIRSSLLTFFSDTHKYCLFRRSEPIL